MWVFQACAASLRHCSLELGGKSAIIVFADWITTAVDATVLFFVTMFESSSRVMHWSDHDHHRILGSSFRPRHAFVFIVRATDSDAHAWMPLARATNDRNRIAPNACVNVWNGSCLVVF